MTPNRISRLCSLAIIALPLLSVGALAQQKTAKECNAEWTANKADIQASGKTKKQFITECRAEPASAAPATPAVKPAAAPTAQPKPSAAPAAAPASSTSTAKPAQATGALGANQFSTEAQAKSHCPSDTVVWANLQSKVYHYSSNKNYGNTKSGAYMCEGDTAGAGFRAAKNEKHP
jgi:hypothetical protein